MARAIAPDVNVTAIGETSDRKTYKVPLPKNGGTFIRIQVDDNTAQYEIRKSAESLYDKFTKLAKAARNEFLLTGKKPTRDEIILQNIEPDTDDAREQCRQAFEDQRFERIVINRDVGVVAAM
jgi:hypothetical protein